MKTKLTLFVAVLAAALFVGGCASADRTNKAEVNSKLTGDPLRKGLVAYYPFNGNAKDASGNGNDGEVKGATLKVDRHGNIDSAYGFEGASEIKAAKPKELTHINTISCWVKIAAIPKYQYVVDFGENSNWIEVIHGSYIRVAGKDRRYFDSKKPVQEMIWHHIVLALNGSHIKLFINGKEDGSITGDSKVAGPFLSIGMPHDHRRGFHGSIDDIRIYNRALSADEVKALYDLEKPKTK